MLVSYYYATKSSLESASIAIQIQGYCLGFESAMYSYLQ
jgi:hypothetical protein